MTPSMFKRTTQSQLLSALKMTTACIRRCPDDHWDTTVGTLPFWTVAYHTLCWTDLYLARSNATWVPDAGVPGAALPLHPKGRRELSSPRPSRRFEREELLRYTSICAAKIPEALGTETAKSLGGPSGFSWITGPRAEVYLYNLRHLAHHGGQLSAFLRRVGVRTPWVREARV